MGNIDAKINGGLSESTENYSFKEYYYLLQISSYFSYARGKWLWFMFVYKSLCIILTSIILIQVGISVLNIKDYYSDVAAQQVYLFCTISICEISLINTTLHRQNTIKLLTYLSSGYDYGQSFRQLCSREINDFNKLYQNEKLIILPVGFGLLPVIGLQIIFGIPIADWYMDTVIQETYVNGVYMPLPLPMWFPFSIKNQFHHYICLLYEGLACLIIVPFILGNILFLHFTFLEIIKQLRLLIKSLEKIEERTIFLCMNKPNYKPKIKIEELYNDPEFIKAYKFCLKQNYEHHQILLRMTNLLQVTSTQTFFAVTLFMGIAIAGAILNLSSGGRLGIQVLSIMSLLFQLSITFILSIMGQQTSDLSRLRKESAIHLDQCTLPTPEIKITTDDVYPFALVLRLRVLQIVCGITSVIMGTVAFIEERGQINLGLGMPAGVFTVIAAGVSIHTSRGFSGYKEPNCKSSLRFLGPRPSVAVPMTFLWFIACMLNIVLSAACLRELIIYSTDAQMTVLSSLLLALSLITLTAVFILLRIDCHYDPD